MSTRKSVFFKSTSFSLIPDIQNCIIGSHSPRGVWLHLSQGHPVSFGQFSHTRADETATSPYPLPAYCSNGLALLGATSSLPAMAMKDRVHPLGFQIHSCLQSMAFSADWPGLAVCPPAILVLHNPCYNITSLPQETTGPTIWNLSGQSVWC